jgi:hypothetical protein
MTTRILLAALAASASLVVAACGGGNKPAAAGGPSGKGVDAASKTAMLNFAKCMREHGVNMPDPQFDSNGGGTVRMGDGKTPIDAAKARSAEQACQHFQDAVKPPPMSAAQQADMRKRALANSRCVRAHGFNMPDPQFDDSGRMTLQMSKDSGIDPNDPKFQEASKTCAKQSGMGGGPMVQGKSQ